MQTGTDILFHGHVRKECIVLEQIADMALLRLQVDVLLRVKEHSAIEDDSAFIRSHNAGDASEGHGLAAAGCSENADMACIGRKVHIEAEPPEILADVCFQSHDFLAFLRSRSSSMFTEISTTAEIAIFTSTQVIAPASSFVRQS